MRGSPEKDAELLANIQAHLPELTKLLKEISAHSVYEDRVYRFYHQSFKVYDIQEHTKRIVETLWNLAPEDATRNPFFEEILQAGGSGKRFEDSHNKDWTSHTRPFVEAFLHAKYFLEMAVKYGSKFEEAPEFLPSGWAGLLYFYNLR
jgi:hypothetical protein